jgi:sterol desaturase/sphingolipid hydroxylase (fatty acid hydroxylase superfamily)
LLHRIEESTPPHPIQNIMSYTLLAGLGGLLAALLYGSFLEWFIHKYVMHTKRLSRLAFERHVVDHHVTRRSFDAFYIAPEEKATYDFGETSFVPVLWAIHLPQYAILWWFWGWPAAIGAALGCALYITGYEVLHFFIHAPKNYWFQRTRLFRFYCEYHRLHHYKPRVNYNIVLPLADLVFGNFSLEPMRPEPSAPAFVPPDTGPGAVWRSTPPSTEKGNL